MNHENSFIVLGSFSFPSLYCSYRAILDSDPCTLLKLYVKELHTSLNAFYNLLDIYSSECECYNSCMYL